MPTYFKILYKNSSERPLASLLWVDMVLICVDMRNKVLKIIISSGHCESSTLSNSSHPKYYRFPYHPKTFTTRYLPLIITRLFPFYYYYSSAIIMSIACCLLPHIHFILYLLKSTQGLFHYKTRAVILPLSRRNFGISSTFFGDGFGIVRPLWFLWNWPWIWRFCRFFWGAYWWSARCVFPGTNGRVYSLRWSSAPLASFLIIFPHPRP